MVETGTRKAPPISSVVRPPRTRRVSASLASLERIGWQAMKMRPRRSSPISSSMAASKSMPSWARSASRPISSYLRSRVLRRRIRSWAWCFAVPMSQAPGRSGTPPPGHCSSAATRASCASSSAVPMSPTTRVSPAMSRADSMRQIASIARCASAAAVTSPLRSPMATAPSHALVCEDLADLESPAVVGCPLQPLEGFVHGAHLPQPVAGDQLFGFGERSIDDCSLVAVEPNSLALGARLEAAGFEHNARLDQLLVELLVRRHRFWRWGSRRLALVAFLGDYQHTHLCLLLLLLLRRYSLGLVKASPTHRMTGCRFGMSAATVRPRGTLSEPE